MLAKNAPPPPPPPPHFVSAEVRKVGTEVRCDCPVYRSSPNICQHALAAAEDLGSFAKFLQWVRKTRKSSNLSQLIADSVPKTGGEKSTTRRKGAPKRKLSGKQDLPVCSASPSSFSSPSQSSPCSNEYTPPPLQVARPPSQSSSCSNEYTPPPLQVARPPSQSSSCSNEYTPPLLQVARPPFQSSSCGSEYTPPPLQLGPPFQSSSSSSEYTPPPLQLGPPFQSSSSSSEYTPPPPQLGPPFQSSSSSSEYTPPPPQVGPYTVGFQMQSPVYAHSVDMYSNCHLTQSTGTDPSAWFRLQSLEGTRIRMCYGCNSPIRKDTTTVPPPPDDLVIAFKERRWYRDPRTQMMKLTSSAENAYYHFNKSCVQMKHPSFSPSMLHIPPDLLLSVRHRMQLHDQFGL